MGKLFEKQIKAIEDQGEKQVKALENLKPKEQTKPIEDKSIISQELQLYLMILLTKEKNLMNELYESVDRNILKFEYIGPTKDVSFYEYMDSKELFSEIKNNRLKFDDALKKQEGLFKKINEVKIGKKTLEQKKID